MDSRRPFEKLGKTMRRVIERCNRGEVLCRRHVKTELEHDDDWFFEPSGERAPPRASLKCINEGWLTPADYGLFGDDPQTWKVQP